MEGASRKSEQSPEEAWATPESTAECGGGQWKGEWGRSGLEEVLGWMIAWLRSPRMDDNVAEKSWDG